MTAKLKLVIIALAFLTSIAGCNSPIASSAVARPVVDPVVATRQFPQLAEKTMMIVYDHDDSSANHRVGIYVPNDDWTDPNAVHYLCTGDRIMVYGDHRPGEAKRLVDVSVQTGKLAGKFGFVARADLRPLH